MSFATVILVVVMAAAYAIHKYLIKSPQQRRCEAMWARLPGAKFSPPLIGDLWRFCYDRENIVYRFSALVKEIGSTVVRVYAGDVPTAVILKPEDIEVVLNNSRHHSTKPQKYYNLLEMVFGRGLVTLNAGEWSRHRKAITPSFHFGVLQQYADVFLERADILCEQVALMSNGKAFDILPLIGACSNETICATAMGATTDEMSKRERVEFLEAMEEVFQIVHYRMIHPWLINDFLFSFTASKQRLENANQRILKYAERAIRSRQQNLENNLKSSEEDEFGVRQHLILIDLLLAKTDAIRPEEIVGEVRTFISATHTTIMTEGFALQMLAMHPEIQEKAYAEVKDVWSRTDLTTHQKLQCLHYLDRVIKETLRLFPPVPIVAREAGAEIKLSGGYEIPEKAVVILGIYTVHRDPSVYCNPEEFNPDRFLPENIAKRHPFSFIPFSAGSRNCIGQKYGMLQMKAVLSSILARFEVFLPEDGPKSVSDIHVTAHIFLSSTHGHKVRLLKRSPEKNLGIK